MTDKERRNLAEKIRQENLRTEKEMIEKMETEKVEAEKLEAEKKAQEDEPNIPEIISTHEGKKPKGRRASIKSSTAETKGKVAAVVEAQKGDPSSSKSKTPNNKNSSTTKEKVKSKVQRKEPAVVSF